MPLSPGQQLGHFEIVAPLGAGGMGEVYRARDTRLGREVALKILPREFVNDRDRRTRFEHEARAVAALNHPGIVALFDIGNDGDTHYIVNELVEGATLRAALTGGAMPQRKAVEVAADIADALGAAHAKGITHRDIKPENIMITRDGRAKILDFGLAKDRSPRADGATETAVTDPGVVMGTAGYMSPEQVEAQQADHRGDVFSFGAVLYEMLSGTRAFAKATQVETLTAILREDPVPLAVSAALQQITARCLEKEPERRFQSMRDLAFALRTSSTATTTTHAAIVTKTKRNWLWPATALACLALVFIPRGEVTGESLKLTPIARDRATEARPAFSPDGKSIAYMRANQEKEQLVLRVFAESDPVVLYEAAGNSEGIVLGRDLNWTTDGSGIIFTPRARPAIVAVSGGAPREISDRPGAAAAIPGTAGFIVCSRRPGGDIELNVVDRIGASPRPHASLATAGLAASTNISVKFSPDAKRLAILAGGSILVVDWPSAALRKTSLFQPVVRSISWMPDSRHIVTAGFLRPGAMSLDTDTGETRVLHPGDFSHVDVRRDGRALALAAGNSEASIVEFTANGEAVRAIASSAEMAQAPAWSPDGSKLAYRQYLSADTAAVIVRESATGTTRQVVRLPVRGTIPSPAFSPDGSRIAYNDNGMLWTILATGGIATSLASDTSGDRPCWSPDGKWIAAIIGGQLTKIPAAGGPSVQLFGPTGGNCLWTNVGIFMMGRSGLERIPESGGQPVTVGLDMHGSIAAATPDGSTISILTVGNQLLSFDSRSAKVTRTVGLQADGLVRGVSVHPDGKRIAGWTQKTLSDLWLLEGFPVPTTGLERLFRKWKDPS